MEVFETEDMKNVMSKILQTLQDSDEEETHAEASTIEHTPARHEISLQFSPKRKAVKPKEFVQGTYSRMQVKHQKSQDFIQKLRQEREKEALKFNRPAPEILERSKKMVGNRAEPLYSRVSQLLEEKTKKVDEIKEKLHNEREEVIKKDLTFKPNIGKKKLSRDIKDFYSYNQEWIDTKGKEVNRIKEKIESEEKESTTFRPELNKNSLKIVKSAGRHGGPLEERLQKHKQDLQQRLDRKRSECFFSFKPEISKGTKVMTRQKSEGNVFDRLYVNDLINSPRFSPGKRMDFEGKLDESIQKYSSQTKFDDGLEALLNNLEN